jgi:hypothetical protein
VAYDQVGLQQVMSGIVKQVSLIGDAEVLRKDDAHSAGLECKINRLSSSNSTFDVYRTRSDITTAG